MLIIKIDIWQNDLMISLGYKSNLFITFTEEENLLHSLAPSLNIISSDVDT